MNRTIQKLAFYKSKAAEAAKRSPHGTAEYHTWQWHAKHAFKYSGHSARNPKYDFGSDGSMRFHCEIDELPGCRFSGYADQLAGYRSIDHTGWFTDTVNHETARGIVALFRMGQRVAIVPGVEYSDSDCDFLQWSDVQWVNISDIDTDYGNLSLREALMGELSDMAHTADHIAKMAAESDREADEKYQCEDLTNRIREDVKATRAKIRALVADIRATGEAFKPTICQTLRDKVAELRAHVQECREALQDIDRNPWNYEEYYRLV